MTKKEREKRLQKLRSFWLEWNHSEISEADYLEKIYEMWEKNNKGDK